MIRQAPTYAEVLECARRIGRVAYSCGPWQWRACRETSTWPSADGSMCSYDWYAGLENVCTLDEAIA